MIRFSCDTCGKKLKVPVEYSSKKVQCPDCQAVLIVPESAEQPAGGDGLRDLLSGLDQGTPIEIEKPKPAPSPASEPVEQYNIPSFADKQTSSGSSALAGGSKYIRSIIFGIIAAALGAVIWAFISKTTGYEIGYIAIGVGFLAGLGVILGGAEQSAKLGVIAAIIAVCGIMGGKLLALNWMFDELANENKASMSAMTDSEILDIISEEDSLIDIAVMSLMTDDMKLLYLDFQTTDQDMEEQWEKLLPEGENLANSWSQDEIVENARAAYSFILTESLKANKGEALKEGFIESFGPMDLLFIFLAVSASYRMCSSPVLYSN